VVGTGGSGGGFLEWKVGKLIELEGWLGSRGSDGSGESSGGGSGGTVVIQTFNITGQCANLLLLFFMNFRWYCCDLKARVASAQSFRLWQQATIEFIRRDHSIIACSRHIYMVLFFTHIPFVVNRAFNAPPPMRLQQYKM